jgi:hypothetical protein
VLRRTLGRRRIKWWEVGENCIMKNFLDEVKEDDICGTYSIHGERRIYVGFWWERQKERVHYHDLYMGWK